MERQELQTSTLSAIPTNGCYQAGLYARLSKDDLQKGESISIETQKLILEKFCNEHGLNIAEYYTDDGYSGATFDRPDFNRMIDDIENGRINCVITKDLSRLGRDYIQTGTYIELYFTGKNVRYIAVDDGVDTLKADTTNDIMMPIRNLFNEWYVRDISKKVRNAKRRRMAAGMFISGQTAYGYQRNPENKNQLIVDEEAAEVVREIFRMALEGNGVVKIAKELSERRILIPSAYKCLKGDTRFARYISEQPEEYKYKWCVPTVQMIMRDMVYVGDMENHKQEKISYKIKKFRTIPKSQRIIVKDTHEPVISREDFMTVQNLISARHRPQKYADENVFKSIIFCKKCGGRLTIQGKNKKTGRMNWYRCLKSYSYPEKCEAGNYIGYKVLLNLVTEKIKEKIALFSADESIPKMLVQRVNNPKKDDRLKSEKQTSENRVASLKNLIRRLYEDYSSGILTLLNYQELLAGYQEEQAHLNERIAEIGRILADSKDELENYQLFKDTLLKFADFDVLDRNMVNHLIDRIEIGHKKKIDGESVQEVDIYFRFIGK